MIKLQKPPAFVTIHSKGVASLAANLALVAPAVLFGSIAALDTLYLITQAMWAAQLSFWLLPVACVLALSLIVLIWMMALHPRVLAASSLRLIGIWRSSLPEVSTFIFALSWWFRRDTPQAPSSIALLFSLIGLGLMIWAGIRRETAGSAR